MSPSVNTGFPCQWLRRYFSAVFFCSLYSFALLNTWSRTSYNLKHFTTTFPNKAASGLLLLQFVSDAQNRNIVLFYSFEPFVVKRKRSRVTGLAALIEWLPT